jgi:hypothetical protein
MSTKLLERPGYDIDLWDDEDESRETRSPSALAVLSSRDDVNEGAAARHDDKLLFDELADELAGAARGMSSTRLALGHPAYVEILALGDQAIPWLLERLASAGDRPIWLRLLGSLTRYQPGAGMETIPEAAAAWIRWGKLHRGR